MYKVYSNIGGDTKDFSNDYDLKLYLISINQHFIFQKLTTEYPIMVYNNNGHIYVVLDSVKIKEAISYIKNDYHLNPYLLYTTQRTFSPEILNKILSDIRSSNIKQILTDV